MPAPRLTICTQRTAGFRRGGLGTMLIATSLTGCVLSFFLVVAHMGGRIRRLRGGAGEATSTATNCAVSGCKAFGDAVARLAINLARILLGYPTNEIPRVQFYAEIGGDLPPTGVALAFE